MSTAKKKWQAESPPARFAHNFANEVERDTWEKGQQAGRWLSQHMYSEKEKREMEKKRRAQQRKAQAQAAQPESAPEESAPGAGHFRPGKPARGSRAKSPRPPRA